MRDFLSYPVNTVRKEVYRTTLSSYDDVQSYFNFSFPALTVCNNLYTTGHLQHLPENKNIAAEYEDLKKEFLKFASDYNYHNSVPFQNFLSDFGFQAHAGTNVYRQFSQPWEDFNVFCYSILESNGSVEYIECNDEIITVNSAIVHGTKQCYTIQQRIKMPMAQHDMFYLDLGFYLNNTASDNEYSFEDSAYIILKEPSTAIHVMLHNIGEMGNYIDEEILEVGHDHTLTVERTARIYMQPPYGECEDHTNKHLYSVTGDKYAYTHESCWEVRKSFYLFTHLNS